MDSSSQDNMKGTRLLKEGDKVIINKYSGTEVKYEGTEYTIVKQEDILAVVE